MKLSAPYHWFCLHRRKFSHDCRRIQLQSVIDILYRTTMESSTFISCRNCHSIEACTSKPFVSDLGKRSLFRFVLVLLSIVIIIDQLRQTRKYWRSKVWTIQIGRRVGQGRMYLCTSNNHRLGECVRILFATAKATTYWQTDRQTDGHE